MPQNSAKKFAFVCSSAAMSGVEFSLLYLLDRLDRRRWTPIVLCSEAGDLTREMRSRGVDTFLVPAPALRSTSLHFGGAPAFAEPHGARLESVCAGSASLATARILKEQAPDLVVTKGMFAHLYGGLAARRAKLPCIWHLQDYISERYQGAYRRVFAGLAARIPVRLVADGEPIKRQLPAVVQSRTTVVDNGVDTAVFRPGRDGGGIRTELGFRTGAIVIGNVARLTPWKGQHHLLDAFARIAGEAPEAVLLLVGGRLHDSGAYERRLRSMTDALGLASRVFFAGYRPDLPDLLAAMDVFVHTATEKDTSPLAVISAMASGLPVVAFDIDGIREIVREDAGILVPCAERIILGESLLRVYRDRQLRNRLGVAARLAVENSLSLDRHCELMERVFHEAAAKERY